MVAVVTGVSIIVFTMYLVARNQPFTSPDLARMMRIILSLGIGTLGATIPGFLNVSYSVAGFAVRAGGALALFVISFWGSPNVEALNLGEPDVEVSSAPQIDIRTRAAPNVKDAARLDASAVVTVPLHVRNLGYNSKPAFIERTEVTIPVGSEGTRFAWRYFVNMHEEAKGVWLSILEDAQPQVVPAGGVWNGEVLHVSDSQLTWADVLKYFSEQDDHTDIARIEITYSNGERSDSTVYRERVITVDCKFDVQKWQREISRFESATGRVPGRVTMECLEELT